MSFSIVLRGHADDQSDLEQRVRNFAGQLMASNYSLEYCELNGTKLSNIEPAHVNMPAPDDDEQSGVPA